MTCVLTLISNPVDMALDDTLVERMTKCLTDEGATVQPVRWLKDRVACDVEFEGVEPARASLKAEEVVGDLPVDYAVQLATERRRKMLIADMDSTIIQVECIDELADFAGLKDKVAQITESAMRGELDFRAALRERVALLAGLDENILEQAYRERVTLTPGAMELVHTMNAYGALTVLVSGGFTFFTDRISEVVGFQINRANRLELRDGKLTGHVLEPIVDSGTKLASLKSLSQEAGLKSGSILAVGDGANDIPMIQAAGLGVAYRAKPKTAAAADVSIRHGDLTALLYLQGYRADQFVSH